MIINNKEPIINETNRESWKAKILSKNQWLNDDCFDSYQEMKDEGLFDDNSLDYKHLQSITGKDYTKDVI